MSAVARDVNYSLKRKPRLGNRTGRLRVETKLLEIGPGLGCSHNLLISKWHGLRMDDRQFFKAMTPHEQFNWEPRVVKVEIMWSWRIVKAERAKSR